MLKCLEKITHLRWLIDKNLRLTELADKKAIVISSASFLVISILTTQILTKNFPIVLILFLLFCLMIAAFSLLTLIPSLRKKHSETKNLLFFHVVSSMEETNYIQKIIPFLNDEEAVLKLLLVDFYQSSCVLTRKYRLLSLAYVFSFLLSIVVFITFSILVLIKLGILIHGTL